MRRVRNSLSFVLVALALCAVVQQEAEAVAKTRRRHATVQRVALVPRDTCDTTLAIPVLGIQKASLRDSFGAPRTGHTHTAIDILAPRGTPVVSAESGTVLKLFTSDKGGLTLYVADPTGRTCYYYAHLDAYAANLKPGTIVNRGDVLGFVGTTGNAPKTTPHLHFGIERLPASGEWWHGAPVNPYPILMARGETVE